MQMLVISREAGNCWPLPSLGARSGLSVDIITSATVLKHSRAIRRCSFVAARQSLLPTIRKHLQQQLLDLARIDPPSAAKLTHPVS